MTTETQHLIDMANQIAVNFAQGRTDTEIQQSIKNHINRFWSPSMRQKINAHLDQHKQQLDPNVYQAFLNLSL